MLYKIKLFVLSVAVQIIATFSYSQNSKLPELQNYINNKKIEAALLLISSPLDQSNFSHIDKANYLRLQGETYLLSNKDEQAFQLFLEARKLFKETNSFENIANINLKIVQLLNTSNYKNISFQPYLDDYIYYTQQQNQPELLRKAYMQAGKCLIDTLPDKAVQYFKHAFIENNRINDTIFQAKIHHNIGVVYSEKLKKFDSAFFHYDIALKVYREYNLHDYESYIYINKASIHIRQENYDDAISLYLKADSLPIKEYYGKNKMLLYGYLSDAYRKKGNYTKTLKYLDKKRVFEKDIRELEQSEAIAEIDRKYRISEKEEENLILKKNQTKITIILVFIALTSLVTFFAMINFRTKKRLAEREKEFEKQKIVKLLRDQELSSINAMIEGQEKERQRIANELHDNLGGLLATLKLYIQNLKVRKNSLDEQYDNIIKNTDAVLEEAYQKVRSIAQTRNAGVLTSEGLVPTIQNYAHKVSASNSIIVEVDDYGMDTRLNNSTEITLFRIVQELITNVIKHAKASQITIHITNHEESLNLIIEDDGSGFDLEKIDFKKGMGLSTIKKRIENLNGAIKIDTRLGKGATIIIDIPIE